MGVPTFTLPSMFILVRRLLPKAFFSGEAQCWAGFNKRTLTGKGFYDEALTIHQWLGSQGDHFPGHLKSSDFSSEDSNIAYDECFTDFIYSIG